MCDYSSNPGAHTIRIKGLFPAMSYIKPEWTSFYSEHNITVLAWGNQQWLSLEKGLSFVYGHVDIAAQDVPDLSLVGSMSAMFLGNTAVVDSGGKMGDWNTSNVKNMSRMFWRMKADVMANKDLPIAQWDTSSVTDMSGMFSCGVLNPDISDWNVSRVKNFSSMFHLAINFDRDISGWDTSSATNMSSMFDDFDDGSCEFGGEMQFDHDLDGWNVNNVTEHTNFKYDGATFAEPNWP